MFGNGGEDWGPADIGVMEKNWGWSGWNPPDAGNAIQEWEGTPFGKINVLEDAACLARIASANACGMVSFRCTCFLGCQFKCNFLLISNTLPVKSVYSA